MIVYKCKQGLKLLCFSQALYLFGILRSICSLEMIYNYVPGPLTIHSTKNRNATESI